MAGGRGLRLNIRDMLCAKKIFSLLVKTATSRSLESTEQRSIAPTSLVTVTTVTALTIMPLQSLCFTIFYASKTSFFFSLWILG